MGDFGGMAKTLTLEILGRVKERGQRDREGKRKGGGEFYSEEKM